MERERLGGKYHGHEAEQYDEARESTPLWLHQQAEVERYLDAFGPGTRVLDVPVGTGRFLDTYAERGFDVVGVDVSDSMLALARSKRSDIDLREGDIFHLDFPNGSFDVVVCVRFLNWVGASDLAAALSELGRVTRNTVIANIKTYVPVGRMSPLRQVRQVRHRLTPRDPASTVSHRRRTAHSAIRAAGLSIVDMAPPFADYETMCGVENRMYHLRRGSETGGNG